MTSPSRDGSFFRPNSEAPSFLWRSATYQTILSVAFLSRIFLHGLNKTEVHGLPRFLDLLKSRQDYKIRRRGLITVSNHISVLDEPLIWGVLPLSYSAVHGYMNHRWTLGSHDLLFAKGILFQHFFTLGQTLPARRLAHDPEGGALQTTMTEAIRLLSKISSRQPSFCPPNLYSTSINHRPYWPHDPVDPFSDLPSPPSYPSSSTDKHAYSAPSRYACNSYSWVHIFPEGMIHQNPAPSDYSMRYFKWGVSRLILEPPQCPDLVPMFIEGTDQVMHETRKFPRFIPRAGKKITVTFGKEVDVEARFGDLRRRWRELVERDAAANAKKVTNSSSNNIITPTGADDTWEDEETMLGIVSQSLWDNPEAVALRTECTLRVREEILKLRRSRGYPDEDPKASAAGTWLREGPKREGRMRDGTWVRDV